MDIHQNHPSFQTLCDANRLQGKCGRCEFRHVHGGRRGRSFAVTGDVLEAEPDCAYLPAIITADSVGVLLSRDGRCEYERRGPLFSDCQIVLVEGDIDVAGVKVEVWRAAMGAACLAAERTDGAAVVTDDLPDVALPIWGAQRGSMPGGQNPGTHPLRANRRDHLGKEIDR